MKTKDINWQYLFKHWIFTLLLGPVISQVIVYFYILDPHQIIGLLEIYPITFLLSLVFSIPTYLFCSFIYAFLAKRDINYNLSKAILILIPIIGIFTTAAIIKGTAWLDIALSYSISSFITGLIFKLNFKCEEES